MLGRDAGIGLPRSDSRKRRERRNAQGLGTRANGSPSRSHDAGSRGEAPGSDSRSALNHLRCPVPRPPAAARACNALGSPSRFAAADSVANSEAASPQRESLKRCFADHQAVDENLSDAAGHSLSRERCSRPAAISRGRCTGLLRRAILAPCSRQCWRSQDLPVSAFWDHCSDALSLTFQPRLIRRCSAGDSELCSTRST